VTSLFAHKCDMRSALQRLDSLLRAKRPDYFASFFPGATETEIASFEEGLGFPVDDCLKDLYRWHNGQPRDLVGHFQNHMVLMPVAQSLRTQRELSSLLADGEFEGMVNWWNDRWIPFLEGPSGDYLCVDMAGAFDGRSGQLIDFVHNDRCRTIVAPDLDTWMESYCRLLANDLLDDSGLVKGVPEYVWVRGVHGYPIEKECAIG
jgi:cell wall assembly regulator SMI1